MEILHYGKYQDNGSSPARRKNVKWYIPCALPLWIRNAHNNKMHNIFEWRNYKNKQTNKKITTTCWRTEELICIPIKHHSRPWQVIPSSVFCLWKTEKKNNNKPILCETSTCTRFWKLFYFFGQLWNKKQFLLTSDPIYKHVSRTWTSTMLVAWNKMDWGEQRDFPGLYNTRFSERRWFFLVAFYGFHQGKVFWSCYISYRLECRASKHLMVL